MKFAIIHWSDAAMYGNEIYSCSDKFKPASGLSIGWVIREDEESITIAMDVFGKDHSECRTLQTLNRRQIDTHMILEVLSQADKNG